MKALFTREFLDGWYSHYCKLETFIAQGGDKTGHLDEELAQWVAIQLRIKNMLPPELKEKLSALKYDFEANSHSWEARYRQLEAFSKTNGHNELPDDQAHEALKDWLIRQIQNKKFLTNSQFQKLDELGVDWELAISRDHRWEQMYLKLKDFCQTFGHSLVPLNWEKDKSLANWVRLQRRLHTQDKLREDRQKKLQALNFVWHIQEVYEAQWDAFYQQLVSYQQKHGHCRVPVKYEKLVSWMERQRIARKNEQLLAERVKQLNDIGFIWSCDKIKRKNWEAKYKLLAAYREKHGHSFVPVNCRENKSLGIWVASQRLLEAKGKLEPDRKQQLDLLEFVWAKDTRHQLQSAYDALWEANFEKLKAYKRVHGTCQVSFKIDPVLQRWTGWQRKLFYGGRLSKERIHKLNEIRFPWSVQEGYWMRMYEALLDFRQEFGHTRVPFLWKPNPPLAAWVYRTKRNKTRLSAQKIELLNQLNFDWTLVRKEVVGWEAMYGRLVQFKREFGHSRVPVTWHEDPKLGKWVSRMRQEKEKLHPERTSQLESIEFDWGYRSGQ